MSRLSDRRQAFVIGMLECRNQTQAAIYAGFPNDEYIHQTAYRLAHDETIQDAVKEVAQRRLNSSSMVAVRILLEIADDVTAEKKDRLKAAEMILNRTGLHATSEHKVAVTHVDKTTDEMIKRIEQLSKGLGLDPKKLLGNLVVEADFVELQPEDDLSDLL